MIKVSVMYPQREGARFDHDYYRDTHLPLVAAKVGPSMVRYSIDRGRSGGGAASPPVYVGMCHLFFESVETFERSFGPHAKAIMADVPNYTDIAPVMQISDVVVD